MRITGLAVLAVVSLTGPVHAQVIPEPLVELLDSLNKVAESGGGQVPFDPQLDHCSSAEQCTFTVFDGAVSLRAELRDEAVGKVSYELAEGATEGGALFAAMAITLSTLAPDASSEARRKMMTDMIGSLASGDDTYAAEIDNLRVSFRNNTPTGAVGGFEIVTKQ